MTQHSYLGEMSPSSKVHPVTALSCRRIGTVGLGCNSHGNLFHSPLPCKGALNFFLLAAAKQFISILYNYYTLN